MAIDRLQDRIRKLKCPLAVDLFAQPEHIPPQLILECDGFLQAYKSYCDSLLMQLKEIVAAIRLDYGFFALYGAKGCDAMAALSRQAHKLGYYVLLQINEPLSHSNAEHTASLLFADNQPVYFDGLVIAAYIGSDAISPFVGFMKERKKDLFVVARTSNRSAAEMQDLRSGSRLAYMAKADIANRFSDMFLGKSGYSSVALVAAASSSDCLGTLRKKYPNLFLWLDGGDYPNANAKNCSVAFDQLGHGAIACVGLSVMAAWCDSEDGEVNYSAAALKAAERHRRNLLRYVSIL